MNTSDRPHLQEFHIEGVKHIQPKDAFESVQNGEAILLDVREEYEYAIETIDLKEIIYLPMSRITAELDQIPTDKPIIVVCKGGVRSSKVARFLSENGFKDVASLDGGFVMWKALHFPTENHLS